MGYRIGFQCFETIESATDYQMSMVVPAISADGSLVHPVKQGGKWTVSGQPVQLSFGHCDPTADFKDGAVIAMAFVGLMVAAYGFRILSKFIYRMMSD